MKLTRADKWLIGFLFIFSVAGIGLNMAMLSEQGQQVAHISKNGQPAGQVVLREGYHQDLRLGGDTGFNVIEADNGQIRMKAADCPDRLCVKAGWIRVAPQQIVCLPYRVVIRLEASGVSDVDDITK